MVDFANTPNAAYQNQILAALPAEELSRIRPLLTRVKLVSAQVLHDAGERIEHVYFVEQGFGSVVADVDEPLKSIEIGLIGRESMVGLAGWFSADAIAYNRVMVQLPGAAHRMPAQQLRENVDNMPVLRQLLQRASQALSAQVAQTAACNSMHTLPERLARWLMMAHDRVDGDELQLTQEFLAIMLAVRRPGVTVAMGTLQAAGLVSHTRGRVVIRDRAGLEAAGCDCYKRVKIFAAALAGRNREE